MRPWSLLAIVAVAISVSACNLATAAKQADQVARAFYAEVQNGADLAKDPHVSTGLQTGDAAAALARARALIPAGQPTSIKNDGWHFATASGVGSSAQLGHVYQYGPTILHVQTVLQEAPGQTAWMVTGFEVQQDGSPNGPIIVGAQPKAAADFN